MYMDDMLATILSTIDAVDSVEVLQAYNAQFCTRVTDSSAIVRVYDALFALRHFMSKYAKTPSTLLKHHNLEEAKALELLEGQLLRFQRLYETQAQFAITPRENFNELGPQTHFVSTQIAMVSVNP